MIAILLGSLFFLAGFVTLLPEFFSHIARESTVVLLLALVLLGLVSCQLLAVLRPELLAKLQTRRRP